MDDTAGKAGLDSATAARLLGSDGPNCLPAGERRNWRRIASEAAREPMFLLMATAALLYLLLGELREGLFLCGMVGVTLGLTLYQEGKTERALEALRELSSPRALVIRDGQRSAIDSRALVCGDLLVLAEGDRIPADCQLIEGSGLHTDESLLTGEAQAVAKAVGAEGGADGADALHGGTLVVRGHGIASVTATGARSQIGRIGASLQALRPERSPLQRETARLASGFALLGLVLSLLLVLLYGIEHGNWSQALLAGIALAMSMLPEEFPVVLAVFPALGARRLARQHVLTRRLGAIETLGAVSVLCVDKTGTLTENRMAVAALYVPGQVLAVDQAVPVVLSGAFRELADHAVLASAVHPYDPMEQAFHRLAGAQPQAAGATLLREYGLNPSLRAMTQVWQGKAGDPCVVAAKGAPEAIVALCGLDDSERLATLAAADAMAARGLRVLGVAGAHFSGTAWPDDARGFDFRFLGLAGLADPLRAGIPEAIGQCHAAGIRVIMVTGDYPATASCIATQAGLPAATALTGEQLAAMNQQQLAARLESVSVCARIDPQQKLRIVQALKADGAIVAMTGDGVNDAPALKAAHVGIAMGQRGTDVAREAAAMVLLDDRFSSIVQAIRGGRRIYGNLRKSMAYIISMHAPIAGMALLPVLLGWPPLLYPMHIVFLELIIDPACSLVYENEVEEADVMCQPPRLPTAPLFGMRAMVLALAQGMGALLVVLAAYGWARSAMPEDAARAFAFTTLMSANLALIMANRSRSLGIIASLRTPNPVLWLVAASALLLLAAALYLPWLAAVFRFAPLSLAHFVAAMGCGFASLLWLELLRPLWRAGGKK
ncbi:cation-translocating P-type ATPase [Oxalobacteraceae bacterium]|nr:cation-translocating P-type ATPase [Oxalobacteraceae bacterium]